MPSGNPHPQRPPSTAHVLIVDDDPSICRIFDSVLRKSGYSVRTADTVDRAIRLMRDHPFDAVVADIFIGEQDGLDLLAQAHDCQPLTPVVLMTGLPSVETAASAIRLNAYEYLTKPVAIDKLTAVIGRAVELKGLRLEKQRIELENDHYRRNLEALVAARTERLEERTRQYQLLFEHSQDAIYMAAPDGVFIAVNQALADLAGSDRAALVGSDMAAHLMGRHTYKNLAAALDQDGFVRDYALSVRRADGSSIDCLLTAHRLTDAQDQPLGHQGIARDITAQRTAEARIRAQNTFLTSVIESLPHPFMVINAHDNAVKIANTAAQRGAWSEALDSGGRDTDVAALGAGDELIRAVRDVLRTGRPVQVEHRHVTDRGPSGDFEVHAYPIVSTDARTTEVILYCIDISERKRLEAVAEAANLMDNLGYIFSGIRHEIGNPINSVKMALSVLSLNLDRYPTDTVREFIDRSLKEVSRVEYLLRALKNFSLYERMEVEPIYMNAFMINFVSLVEADFKSKQVRIQSTVGPGSVWARIDQRAFHQVMLNLFINAADALEQTEGATISVVIAPSGNQVEVRVTDNGIGMDARTQTNLFRPFTTSKPHGTGLGLVIVKKMLAQMDSTIRITSAPDRGTTVILRLPRVTGNGDAHG